MVTYSLLFSLIFDEWACGPYPVLNSVNGQKLNSSEWNFLAYANQHRFLQKMSTLCDDALSCVHVVRCCFNVVYSFLPVSVFMYREPSL